MSTYTRIKKETASYSKRDKIDMGWFKGGWFTQGWFKAAGDLYHRISKGLSTYSKVDKE